MSTAIEGLDREVARLRVAARFNLTHAQEKRLIGEDEGELKADAEGLIGRTEARRREGANSALVVLLGLAPVA